jgi:putative ABC transport system substrate-binding protein
MRRRKFVVGIGLSGAGLCSTGLSSIWPLAARAQDAGRTYRVGMMFPFPRDAREAVGIMKALFDELRRHGYIEGQNLAIDYRAWAPHVDLISDYAAELIKAQPDVIAVGGPVAVRAIQRATETLPILAITDDMVGEGVVRSMARPEGNTTGVSILATELDGKRQEILIETVPGLHRIGASPIPIRLRLHSSTLCSRPLAHAISSFQFIGSLKPMKSQRPSRRQRHPARRR